MAVTKLERDGKVAVVYSPRAGVGWSTWNPDHAELLLFDSEIAEAVLAGKRNLAAAIATVKSNDEANTDAANGLQVAWLSKGLRFCVDERLGIEEIVVLDRDSYHVA